MLIGVLTKGKLNAHGLYDLHLDLWKDGEGAGYVGRLLVESGAPRQQSFRTVPTERRGVLEPIPEGTFDVGDLVWSTKPGDYSGKWFSQIDSPIWQSVYHGRAIGFHLDGNRSYAPGSAGCPVFRDMETLKRFVELQSKYGKLSRLYVDWGLGYVKVPSAYKVPSAAPKNQPDAPFFYATRNGKKVKIPAINGRAAFFDEHMTALELPKRNYNSKTRTVEFLE